MDIIKYRRELKPLEKICVSKEAANKIIQKAHEEAEKALFEGAYGIDMLHKWNEMRNGAGIK